MIDVDIYHDESKEHGFWHGLLLVPRSSREELLHRLAAARKNTGWNDLVEVKSTKDKGKKLRCLRSWLSIAVASMIRFGSMPYDTGCYGGSPVLNDSCRGLSFGVLHAPNSFGDMGSDWLTNVQTTLRIALKGLLHYSQSQSDETIVVRRLVLHGDEHYRGRLDPERVLGRLGDQLRDHLQLADDAIVEAHSNDHRVTGAPIDDCHLLQLTDCLTGGVRVIGSDPSHHLIAGGQLYALQSLVARWEEGPARMRMSRFERSFTWSTCRVIEDEWKFERAKSAKPPTRQLALF